LTICQLLAARARGIFEIRVATVGVTPEAAAEYILDGLRRREII
jgi:hypothetical protein